MPSTDHRLRRHLAWVIVLKLVLLTALWWGFIRDARVSVSPQDMSRQFAPHPIAQGAPHGQ
ncbi:cytochrome oxidase putative small subunit CydP [Zoogloea sp.]|uniref:cytochrome oxidase putative small subunit CydP n=1 Tax=Zoogloea sp. TaxID=49181 RepID=UPI0025FE4E17|nr:cytochrome oxidase putative small subunit CydP [Zoogloea sp.]MCK6394732.1 hypothetical protein [Zoogloea sp.]